MSGSAFERGDGIFEELKEVIARGGVYSGLGVLGEGFRDVDVLVHEGEVLDAGVVVEERALAPEDEQRVGVLEPKRLVREQEQDHPAQLFVEVDLVGLYRAVHVERPAVDILQF